MLADGRRLRNRCRRWANMVLADIDKMIGAVSIIWVKFPISELGGRVAAKSRGGWGAYDVRLLRYPRVLNLPVAFSAIGYGDFAPSSGELHQILGCTKKEERGPICASARSFRFVEFRNRLYPPASSSQSSATNGLKLEIVGS